MKRLIALALLACLLLCGCEKATNTPTEPTSEPTQAPTTSATEAPTEPTTDTPTEPTSSATEVPTEPAPQEKVTVYLVERSDIFDSGYIAYNYDENYNMDSYQVFTIEDALMYSCYYEEKNANGMPTKHRTVWGDDSDEAWGLTWHEDGKLKEAQYDGDDTGSQFEYDQAGKLIEKKEYYEAELQSTVYYEYDGDVLQRIYCMDTDERLSYECRVENGRIVEKLYDSDGGSIGYSLNYKYDKNGNLERTSMCYEGETQPSEVYTYKAVEVDAGRAAYLLEQQKYLLSSNLEYIWPNKAVKAEDPGQPEVSDGLTVEQLRQQMAEEGKSFAVAYLGYLTYDYEDVFSFIRDSYPEVCQQMPFLLEIPEKNVSKNAPQGEVYCIIPADPRGFFEVYAGSEDTSFEDEVFYCSREEPYLLVCNTAFSPDTEMMITDFEDRDDITVWNPKLDDYLFVEQPRYADGTTEALDFTPYNEILTSYYEDMLEAGNWELPAKEDLVGTTWFWYGYTPAGDYYEYRVIFQKDTLDVFWNSEYSEENTTYDDAPWKLEDSVLTIDFGEFAGVRKYNLLVDWEESSMYIATDATGEKITWDSEPLYRFLMQDDAGAKPMDLVGTWERVQTEVEGDVNESPAGQVIVQITGTTEDNLRITYTDNMFDQNDLKDKALLIKIGEDTMGFKDAKWTAQVDYTGFGDETYVLAISDDGNLVLRRYMMMEGAPWVAYEYFRPVA